MANNGKAGNQQVIPESWIDQCAAGKPELFDSTYQDYCPNAAYSKFWWVNSLSKGDMFARGVFGQMIYVNREQNLVIVKLSTYPDYVIPDFTRYTLAAFDAIVTGL